MRTRPWRELFEQLPPEDQAEIKANTEKVVAELKQSPGAATELGAGSRRPAPRAVAGGGGATE